MTLLITMIYGMTALVGGLVFSTLLYLIFGFWTWTPVLMAEAGAAALLVVIIGLTGETWR